MIENPIMTEQKLLCGVCNKNEQVGVCCVPGVPYSTGYCEECLRADAHPYDILVAQTAILGGIEGTNLAWQEMILNTLIHLEKEIEEFEEDVQESIRSLI